MKTNYSVHGFFNFCISGEGKLYDYLAFQFNYFKTKNAEKNNDLVISIVNNLDFSSCSLLNDGVQSYGLEQNKMYLVNNGKAVCLYGDIFLSKLEKLEFDCNFSRMYANIICDMVFRLKLIDHGIALVHASCVSRNGRGVLMPAWKGTGKTTLSLKMVKKGFDFLGDDKVWIKEDQIVYAYPRYVVVKESNAEELRGIVRKKIADRFKMLNMLMENAVFKKYGKLVRIAKRLLNAFPRQYYIEELIHGVGVMGNSPISVFYYLQKLNEVKQINVSKLECDTMVNNIVNIDNIEWNYELLNIAAGHDILFANGPRWTSELTVLYELEKNVIRSVIEKSDCFKVELPTDRKRIDWDYLLNYIEESQS